MHPIGRKIYRCLLLPAAVFACLPCFAQATRKGATGATLYVKSCEPAGTDMELCVLCADKALITKGALYLHNTRTGKATPIAMTATQAKALSAGKTPQEAGGSSKTAVGQSTGYSVSKGGVATLVLSLNSGYAFLTTDEPGSGGSTLPETIARIHTIKEITALGNCLTKRCALFLFNKTSKERRLCFP